MDYKTIIFILFIGWCIGLTTYFVISNIVETSKKKPVFSSDTAFEAINNNFDHMKILELERKINALELNNGMLSKRLRENEKPAGFFGGGYVENTRCIKPEPAKNDWAEKMMTSNYNVRLTMLRLQKEMVESRNIKLEKENRKLKDQVELLKATLDVYGDHYARVATDSLMKNHHFCDTKKQFVENGCCCGEENNRNRSFSSRNQTYDHVIVKSDGEKWVIVDDTDEKIEWIWKFDRIGMSMKDGSVVSISKPESGFLLKDECSTEVWEKLTELTKIKKDGSTEGE